MVVVILCGKLVVVFLHEFEAFFPRHLIVLNHSAGIAQGAPEPKLNELHVVVQIVDLIVQAVEIRKGSVGVLWDPSGNRTCL